MGLRDYIGPGTYACVTNVFYEKDLRRCTGLVSIYADEGKKQLLANTSVVCEGSRSTFALESKISLRSAPPETPGDLFYLVGENPQGAWSDLAGRFAQHLEGRWQSWVDMPGNVFYVVDEKKYMVRTGGSFSEVKNMTADSRLWDEFFRPEVALGSSNPTKQMYAFMKTLDLFSNCRDC